MKCGGRDNTKNYVALFPLWSPKVSIILFFGENRCESTETYEKFKTEI